MKDSLPPKPFNVIKGQVEYELGGKPLYSVFSSVDEAPLACASIAQVVRILPSSFYLFSAYFCLLCMSVDLQLTPTLRVV